jgi:protein involved in polysaccharide export with SLBB domain
MPSDCSRRRRSSLARAAVILAALTSLAGRVRAQSDGHNRAGVVLAPGDVIHIDVFRNKELSGEFPIAPDGSITHPLYHELKVAGLPLDSVHSMLRSFIARYETNPNFVMIPLIRVIAGGEVRQPNILTVPQGTTIAQVIALAGGPTDRGRLDEVHVFRGTADLRIDLTKPDVASTQLEVHSGDQVIVSRRRNVFQDYIAPASSVLAALAAVATVIITLTR